MNIVLAFTAAVVLHQFYKWAGWKTESKRPWGDFWKERTPAVVKTVIMDVVVCVLWMAGILAPVVAPALKMFGMKGDVEVTALTSFLVGWLADSIGRTLMLMLDKAGKKT